jgi:YD repeat-containing protein
LISVKNPNNIVTYYEYDDNDNLISVLNPNSYVNNFDYNPLDQETEWNSPLGYKTYYEYDKDKRLTKTVKPSGKTISYSYTNNQLSKTATDESIYNYSYDCLGQISSVNTNANEKTDYQYDGELLTKISQTGTLNQDISFTYNSDFLPSSVTYSNEKEEFAYDKDNLLISSNNALLTRDKKNALIEKVTDNTFTRTITNSLYADKDKVIDKIDKNTLFEYDKTSLNGIGQILKLTEKQYDRTIHYIYSYDKQGRLTKAEQKHSSIKNQKPNSYNYGYQKTLLNFVCWSCYVSLQASNDKYVWTM